MGKLSLGVYDTVMWENISETDQRQKLWVVVTSCSGGKGGLTYGPEVRDVRSQECKDCFHMGVEDWDKRLPWVALERVGADEFVVIDVEQILRDGSLVGAARKLYQRWGCNDCRIPIERLEDIDPKCPKCRGYLDRVPEGEDYEEDCDDNCDCD